jgi:hypothetical protein
MTFEKRLRLILVLGAVGVIGAAVWAVKGPKQENPPSQRMPDGSVVTVRVKYGEVVRVPAGNWWQQLAGQVLPDALAKRLGLSVLAVTNGHASTFVIITTANTNGTPAKFPPAPPFRYSSWVAVSDDAGNEFELSAALQSIRTSNSMVEVFMTPLVSHAAELLRVHLFQLSTFSGSDRWSEFLVANPAPHSKPHWTAGQMPMTNRVDDLTVVLAAIKPVEAPAGNAKAWSKPQSAANLLILEHGAPSTNWDLADFAVEDEEGNRFHSGGIFSALETRKFLFRLYRKSPVAVLSCPVISLPQGAGAASSQIRTNFGAYPFNLLLTHSWLECFFYSGETNLSHRITVEYTDENGNKQTPFKDFGVNWGGALAVHPPIPDAVKSADITITLITNRFVEFLARPEPAAGNRGPAKR